MTQNTTANFLKSIRQYLWSKNFTEVEIPYLNKSLPLEPNIYSFKTTWTHKNQDFFLPTSPELALKKYISENNQNCFAISHCFRDLEDSNATHTPEFLMLEWYEINKNLEDLKISTKNFIKLFLPNIELIELKLNALNFDNEPDFNQYFLNEIEPNLPKNKAVFITGYPAFLSPLAKANQRFELYINGIEIGNGCEENRDPVSIQKSFEIEQNYRQSQNLPLHPYSTEFAKLCSSLPPCVGVGLGVERLFTIVNKK